MLSTRSRAVFIKNQTTGELYRAGDTMKRLKLAETLQIIADSNSSDAFYNGTLSEQIVKEIRDRGGIITRQDLADYTVDLREALSIDLNNSLTVYTTHAPSSGPILAFILNLLQGNAEGLFFIDIDRSLWSTAQAIITRQMLWVTRRLRHYSTIVCSKRSNSPMPNEVNLVIQLK